MNARIEFVEVSAEQARQSVSDLRRREYAKATGFSLDLSTLSWSRSDDESFVLAAQAPDGRCVAPMRGELIDDLSLLERKLECSWHSAWPLKLPVLLLSRAATDSAYRASGLNLALRYWFIRLAQAHRLGAVVGTFVSGSPREATLRAMGYRFYENAQGWTQSSYRSAAPVHVVALDVAADAERALAYGARHAREALSDFPFHGPLPGLRVVRSM